MSISFLSSKHSSSLLLNQNLKLQKISDLSFVQSSNFRIKQIEDQAKKCAQNRTVDEVIRRPKDRVIQQAATIKDSFFACNKQLHGKINNTGLQKVRKVLAVFLSPVLSQKGTSYLGNVLLAQLELNPQGLFLLLMS